MPELPGKNLVTNFRNIKSNLKKTYDDLAVYWGNDLTLSDWGVDDLKDFAKKVKTSGGFKVLDLGCGSGVHSKHLLAEGLKVYGLDLSPKMISESKKRVPQGEFLVGDMEKMPFSNMAFDGVYARASLLHIPKNHIPKVLNDINRVLKKGGIFYLAVKKGEGEEEKEDVRHGRNVRRFFSFFQENEIKHFLKEAEFRVISLKEFLRTENSTAWIMIFASKV